MKQISFYFIKSIFFVFSFFFQFSFILLLLYFIFKEPGYVFVYFGSFVRWFISDVVHDDDDEDDDDYNDVHCWLSSILWFKFIF